MLYNNSKTKIVCTLGPSTDSEDTLTQMVESGLSVCRFNFSHGSQDEHKRRMDLAKKVSKKLNKPIALMLDTKGPEIRTGNFEKEVYLEVGQKYVITMEDVVGTNEICTVSYKQLINDVNVGSEILIDDGLVGLKVIEIKDKDIICTVENAGTITKNKGVNIPGVVVNLPALTEKDISDIEFGIQQDIDYIAASFVRKMSDVLEIREILEKNDATDIAIISKIENEEGVKNLDEILKVSDGIMVARGDLGVEIPTEDIPIVQKMMIQKANKLAKPVITATQMLDSMIRNPRPTRAEVTDVANAIYDGTDGIMLSGETAAGKYPVEAVKMMTKIAMKTEQTLDYSYSIKNRKFDINNLENDREIDINGLQNYRELDINNLQQTLNISVTDAISHATCRIAKDLKASTIITATSSGHTSRMISKFRPKVPILATSNKEKVLRQLALVWGVIPLKSDTGVNTDRIIENSIEVAKEAGCISDGELVVITAGVPSGVSGTTNLIKVHTLSKEIARGVGVGNQSVEGKAFILDENYLDSGKVTVQGGKNNLTENNLKLEPNKKIGSLMSKIDLDNERYIVVSKYIVPEMIEYLDKAVAIVTEESGMTSFASIYGITNNKPVILSAQGIFDNIETGETITVDAARGVVYKGSTRVL
jgi:pyruvate kinase